MNNPKRRDLSKEKTSKYEQTNKKVKLDQEKHIKVKQQPEDLDEIEDYELDQEGEIVQVQGFKKDKKNASFERPSKSLIIPNTEQ